MTSVPYPTFFVADDGFEPTSKSSLSAVGRCRIEPSPPSSSGGGGGATETEYDKIVEKARQQASVASEDPSGSEQKKLKKKYMKECVAMCRRYMSDTLGLDPSVVDVEMCLRASDLVETDGCLASNFLDAGCSNIVVDGSSLDALGVARLPSNRLVGRFRYSSSSSSSPNSPESSGNQLRQKIDMARAYCDGISVEIEDPNDVTEDNCLGIVESIFGSSGGGTSSGSSVAAASTVTAAAAAAGGGADENQKSSALEVIICLPKAYCSATPTVSLDDLAALVGSVSKSGSANKGNHNMSATVCLPNPTAQQLGACYAACCRTDRDDGLYTTVVCTRSGEALGLVYSSVESVVAALECGRGVYYSRSRQNLWRKGDTSGHYQQLHRIDVDCDGDALRFTVTQLGEDVKAFCHLNTLSCWGMSRGLRLLEETLVDRLESAPEGSYTKRLFDDSELLRNKLVEEAQELSEADTKQHVAEELADVLYFAMVKAVKAGVSIDDAVSELDARARKVTRRQGDSKAHRIAAGQAILEGTTKKKKKEPEGDKKEEP